QIGVDDREEMLLNAASIATLYRRAGVIASSDTAVSFELSVFEERPRVNKEAGQHLRQMLAGEFKTVLLEWLGAIDKTGARVPEEYLPALFDEGRAEHSLQELIISVAGKRGEWLSRQNPEWNYATQRDAKELWETGDRTQRLSLLSNLRKCDPGLARELLATTWSQESAKDRAAFLERLGVGVSYDDEEFLNKALLDRSADVRRVARETIPMLTNAQFTKRL